MSASCDSPIPFDTLLEYLSGALDEAAENRVEDHLFGCGQCSATAERIAGIQAAIATSIPPALSPARFAALEREGLIEQVNRMVPGETAEVFFPAPGRLLVHRLSHLPLDRARRVDVELRTLTGDPMARLENVPFDAARGEVLVACQAHFAESYPHDGTFTVELVSEGKTEEIGAFTVYHRVRERL